MTGAAEGAPAPSAGSAAPFPGLRPFSFDDHPYFFGREDQTFALCALLLRNHFIAVIGSSGSGKSSIVQAGLLPELDKENKRSGGDTWHWITMRPERDPIGSLARALAGSKEDALFEARRDRIRATLGASSRGISEAMAHTAGGTKAQLVLIVDQFEELFRYRSAGAKQLDPAEAEQRRDETTEFVELLLNAAQNRDITIRVLITMRSDFIGECALFQGLPEAVSAAQFLVPSLSKDQRREAIREQIKLAGGGIEAKLVEKLVEDSGVETDQLPVLQHCLARLWTRATSKAAAGAVDSETPDAELQPLPPHLTVEDYDTIGGLAGALSGHAEEILETLPGHEKTIEQIFRALGEIDKDGRAIRRARPLAQLVDETFIEREVGRESVETVLERFRADDCSFILPPVSTVLADQTVIDVGHEALLRRWKRVCGDADATGERADKRDIGWLRQEQKDAESYQFLCSCVDPYSPNDSGLPANQVERYSNWWKSRKPSKAWAARYGDKFDDVERLIRDSSIASARARWLKRISYAAAAVVAIFVITSVLYLREQDRRAQDTFKTAINAAQVFSNKILDTFNAGQVSTSGALVLQEAASNVYPHTNLQENEEIAALRTQWLLTDSDLDDALDKIEEVRAQAEEAEHTARKYLAANPDSRRWQTMLYGSLFRLGDIDLKEKVDTEFKEKKTELALTRYHESEQIARKLNAVDTTGHADADELAERRFNLAFAINKVGEALQVKGDYPGALAKYREALPFAADNENAARAEQVLQFATTKVKIASVLSSRTPPDLDGAVQNYSDAIRSERAFFEKRPDNNIVRSNLASADEGRAQALLRNKMFEPAFRDFMDAARLFVQLSEEDSRNVSWLVRLAQVRLKYGTALEDYARSRNEPFGAAIEQYKAEVAALTKLTERRPTDRGWRDALAKSKAKLDQISAATPAGNSAPEK